MGKYMRPHDDNGNDNDEQNKGQNDDDGNDDNHRRPQTTTVRCTLLPDSYHKQPEGGHHKLTTVAPVANRSLTMLPD